MIRRWKWFKSLLALFKKKKKVDHEQLRRRLGFAIKLIALILDYKRDLIITKRV